MLHLVAGLWAHGDGELSAAQETELFQELIDSPLWFRLNATFQTLVLTKLQMEFNYDAIDLIPNCDANLFTLRPH
jgi:hypothetical protein